MIKLVITKYLTKILLYVILGIFLLAQLYYPVLRFFSLSILFFVLLSFVERSLFIRFILSLVCNFALWICLFSFLKFFPVSLDTLVSVMSFFSVLLTFGFVHKINVSNFKGYKPLEEILSLVFVGIFVVMFSYIPFLINVPPGADMATHVYTARVILEHNTFPATHYPIVPINTFGFGPYGLSVIIALIVKTFALEIYKASFFSIAVIYPLFASLLFIFLRKYFSLAASMFSVLFIMFVDRNIINYIEWGGNTTVFSIMLVLTSIIVFRHITNNNFTKYRFFLIPLCLMLLVASFYTHPTASIIICIISAAFFLKLFVTKKNKLLTKKQYVYLVIVLLLLLLPFITSIRSISSSTAVHLNKDVNAPYFGISNNLNELIPTSLRFIRDRIGERFMWITTIGFLFLLSKRKFTSTEQYFLIWIVFTFIIILNAPLKFLPVTEVFFPDRSITLSLIPFSYFFATAADSLLILLNNQFTSKKKFNAISILIVIYILGGSLFANVRYVYTEVLLGSMLKNSMLSDDDMIAFQWIKEYLPRNVVFANNYGDAGIWIPGLIGKMVNYNDVNAHYIYELETGQKNLHLTYVFIGSKKVYGGIRYTEEIVNNNSVYKQVFKVGNSSIYEISYAEK